MQIIKHKIGYTSIHPIFDELEKFYAVTSEPSAKRQAALFNQAPKFDRSFAFLQNLFNLFGGNSYNFTLIDKQYKKLQLPKYDSKNIIVAFSGGKDSTAAALHYKKRGYNVYLFHTLNINKAYPDEYKSAELVADYLNLPIHKESIELSGKLDFIEHPMKNIIIANMALQWGIENNLTTKVAFGNYYNAHITEPNFYICGDDMIEMWWAYENIMRTAISGFKMYIGLKDIGTTLNLLAQDKELLGLCQSCLGAHRFREYNHNLNEKKYGIELLPGRCGSCWKCAAEYIYMADHDVLEYNEPYYIHCLDVLRKIDKRENGVDFIDIENLWRGFFVYAISKSKYKNILEYKRGA